MTNNKKNNFYIVLRIQIFKKNPVLPYKLLKQNLDDKFKLRLLSRYWQFLCIGSYYQKQEMGVING